MVAILVQVNGLPGMGGVALSRGVQPSYKWHQSFTMLLGVGVSRPCVHQVEMYSVQYKHLYG